jgi:hypothetical protein
MGRHAAGLSQTRNARWHGPVLQVQFHDNGFCRKADKGGRKYTNSEQDRAGSPGVSLMINAPSPKGEGCGTPRCFWESAGKGAPPARSIEVNMPD